MTNQHPITPSPELVQQWLGEFFGCVVSGELSDSEKFLATQAAQWGADVELEACCKHINQWFAAPKYRIALLRAARRPRSPSLAEGPTDEEVDAWVDQQGFIRGHGDHPCGFWIDDGDAGALVRAALARWGK